MQGVAELAPVRLIYAVSILKGDEYPISKEELDLLLSIPSDTWIEATDLEVTTLRDLARRGLVLTDDDERELAELRRRDELLESCGWSSYAALYHFLTKWSRVDVRTAPEEEFPPITRAMIEEFVAARGRPPEAFYSLERPQAVRELPLVRKDGGLYAALADRKTTRGFDRTAPLTLEELAVSLYYV